MPKEQPLEGFRLFDFDNTGRLTRVGNDTNPYVREVVNAGAGSFRERLLKGEILTTGHRPIEDIASGQPPISKEVTKD